MRGGNRLIFLSGQTSTPSSVPNRSTDLPTNRQIIGKGLASFTTASYQLGYPICNLSQSTQSCPSLANIPRLDCLSSDIESNGASNMDRSASCPMICLSSSFNSGINTDSSAINNVSSAMPSHILSANWSSIEQCGILATSSSSNPEITPSVTVNNNFEQNGVCVPSTSFLETGVQNDPNESFLSLLNGPFVSSCDQSTPNLEQLCFLDLMDLDVDEARALVDPLNTVHTASRFADPVQTVPTTLNFDGGRSNFDPVQTVAITSNFNDGRTIVYPVENVPTTSKFNDGLSIVEPLQTVPATVNFNDGRFIDDHIQSVPTLSNSEKVRALVVPIHNVPTTSNFDGGRFVVDPVQTVPMTSLLPAVLEDFQDMEIDG